MQYPTRGSVFMPTGFFLTLYTESTAGDCMLEPLLVQFSSLSRVYIQSLEVCILLWLSRALMHQPVPLWWGHLVILDHYQWPLDHTSVQTRCRPKVVEGTISVFIMLGNIVEIAAEGKGRTTKLHEHWLSTHPTYSMGQWASCLWAVENCHTAILHDVPFMCGPQTQFQIEWGSLP